MRTVAIVSLLLWFSLPLSAQTWQSIGPPGGDVRSLAQAKQNPDLLYLGTTDGHVFGSTDSGEHWSLLGQIGERPDSVVTAILVDPRDSQKLYAATWTLDPTAGGGIFQSSDGGRTWRASGLAGQAVRALAQAPSDPDRLVAGTLEGVFGSRDAGKTWMRVSPESSRELRNLDSLTVDPRDADVFYAGTYHLPWKTSDGGRTWIPVHSGMIDDSDVMSLLIDRVHPDFIYASACSGIYRSANGAALWQKIQGIPYTSRRTQVITQDPVHPETIYAGTTEGLWRSGDSGAAWLRVTPGDWVINAMVLPVNHPGRVVLGTEKLGVVVSDDGGAHFREANNGFNHRRITAVAFDGEHPGRILAVLANALDPVLTTENGGETWAALGPGLATRQLKHLFVSREGWWASLQAGGLMQYDAAHAVWKRRPIPFAARGVPPPAERNVTRRNKSRLPANGADPVVNDMFFTSARWFAATESGLLVSDDRGERWQRLALGPSDSLPVDSVRASIDGKLIWAVSQRGLLFSKDGGRQWSWHDLPLVSGGAVRLELASAAQEPEGRTLVAIAYKGLFISHDGGDSWQPAGPGLPQAPVQSLAVMGNVFVAAPYLGGLFLSQDGGANWTRMEGNLKYGFFSDVAAEKGKGISMFLAASATDGLYEAAFGNAVH